MAEKSGAPFSLVQGFPHSLPATVPLGLTLRVNEKVRAGENEIGRGKGDRAPTVSFS